MITVLASLPPLAGAAVGFDGTALFFAEVRIDDNPYPSYVDPDVGDWHRAMLPGTYDLQVRVPSELTAGTFHVEPDGPDLTGPLNLGRNFGCQHRQQRPFSIIGR